MILSMVYANLGPTESASDEDALSGMGGDHESKPYLLIGTGYALPDEDEPTRGRIIIMSCSSVGSEGNTRKVRHVTELQVRGGVYALCQFYNQKVLATVNSKTHVCELSDDGTGAVRLSFLGIGHHGHILSLFVKSKATRASASKSKALKEDETMMDDTPTKKKPKSDEENMGQLAIVGDLMRSISLVQYYPEHKALEEIARDFNANWTTAIEMLTDDIYLGAENWNHLYVLRRNTKANSEEVRCRLDTIGEFHLGEMCNKFMCGSLIMPHSTASSAGRRKVRMTLPSNAKGSGRDKMVSAASTRAFRPTVTIGTQTLFATVDGTLGSILGLDARTTAFFKTLERAMAKTITPVGDLSHDEFRAFNCERRVHPSHGFVDGDLVESFLDLDRPSMEAVVKELNRDGGWDIDNFVVRNQLADDNGADEAMENELELAVEDVLAMVEEMTMFH
jgi:DNA damage-binding protein 1